jgi:hypothetical protein
MTKAGDAHVNLDRLTFMFYLCSVLTSALTLPENGADPELRLRALAQLDRLDELAEIGMKAARLVGLRADNAAPEEDLNALAMAYARAARAVRLCVMLHAKVVKDLRDGDRADLQGLKDAEAERRDRHKGRIEHLVWRKAERVLGEDDEDGIEALMNEASERLDYEDMYGDLMTRPIGEMVEEISRFVGLGEVESDPQADEAALKAERAPDLSRPPGMSEAEWVGALIKGVEAAEKALAAPSADSS